MNLEQQNTSIKSANFQKDSKLDGKFIGLITLNKDAFSNKQEVYFRANLKAGIAFALKYNINDGEVSIYIGKSFKENHITNETFRYDVKEIEREKKYKLEIKFGKWSIDTLKINGEEIPNVLDKTLTHWDLVQFYSKSLKSDNYIEAISIAYTLIELQLEMLLKQNGVQDKVINDLDYLKEKSRHCLKEGYIENELHSKICAFNTTRANTIHNILKKSIMLREVKEACKEASFLMGEIQSKWLKFGEVKFVNKKEDS